MSALTLMVTGIATLFLSTALVRIVQYASTQGLFSDPCMAMLIMMGFFTGLTYLIGNYEVQRILYSYLRWLPFPLAPIAWLFTGVILVCYLYLVAVRHCSVFAVPTWIARFLVAGVMSAVVVDILLYRQIPFFRLQVLNGLMVSIMCIVATMVVAPIFKTILAIERHQVYGAQFRWFVITINLLFAATVLLAVDSLYKLWFDSASIYTPLYVAVVLCHTLGIIALHIMIEGNLTYLVYYPARIRTYLRLRQLYQTIQRMVQFPDAYNIPLPGLPSPRNLEALTYRTVIMITDRHSQLDDDSPLKQAIESIIRLDIPLDTMTVQLANISW